MSSLYDTIVIGAGQAGLASVYYLQRARSRFLVLYGGGQIIAVSPAPIGRIQRMNDVATITIRKIPTQSTRRPAERGSRLGPV